VIFRTTTRQREIEDAALRQTAALRRRREQRPTSRRKEDNGLLRGIDSRKAPGSDEGSETWRER